MGIVVIDTSELQLLIEAAVEKGIANSYRPRRAEISDKTAKLLCIKEVADLLQVSVSSVNTYKRQGSLPFYRMGRRVFFKEAEVLASLKKINK